MKQLIQTINKWKYKRHAIQPIFQLITVHFPMGIPLSFVKNSKSVSVYKVSFSNLL